MLSGSQVASHASLHALAERDAEHLHGPREEALPIAVRTAERGVGGRLRAIRGGERGLRGDERIQLRARGGKGVLLDADGDSVLVEAVAEVFAGGDEFADSFGSGIGCHIFALDGPHSRRK